MKDAKGVYTVMTKYELEVKMLVDSWVYGGIADLIKQMPEGVLGVNVLGIKKQEGAWDSTCLSSVMQDYEENKTIEEQKPNSSLSERPIHEWDSLAEDMDVRVESHKKNMAEEQKLIAVQKRLAQLNEGRRFGTEGYLSLSCDLQSLDTYEDTNKIKHYTLHRTTLYDIPPCIVTDSMDKLYDYVFNQLEPNNK